MTKSLGFDESNTNFFQLDSVIQLKTLDMT